MSKYKVGDEFIIEIDSVMESKKVTLYGIKGFNALVFDTFGLDHLVKHKDPYNRLLDEVKGMAAHIVEMAKREKESRECESCVYRDVPENDIPCSRCSHAYTDKWSPR